MYPKDDAISTDELDARVERVGHLISLYQGDSAEFLPRDLICDIGHWMDRNPNPDHSDFRGECFSAMDHYAAETSPDRDATAAEQAAVAEDEWRVWVVTREDEEGDAYPAATFSTEDAAQATRDALADADHLSTYSVHSVTVDGETIEGLVEKHGIN